NSIFCPSCLSFHSVQHSKGASADHRQVRERLETKTVAVRCHFGIARNARTACPVTSWHKNGTFPAFTQCGNPQVLCTTASLEMRSLMRFDTLLKCRMNVSRFSTPR